MSIVMFYSVLFGIIPLFFKRIPKKIEQTEFVSILIPAFNDGDILEQNLQNLMKLHYPNFEVVVVYSEKSTDRTAEVAMRFAREYEKVHVFSESVSKSYALNLGIDNAKGDFILFLDSDVFIYDGFIEHALNYFTDENIKLVNACFLGFNTTHNLVTRVSWGLSNSIAFFGIGTNKFLKNMCFMGFGGVWRKNALIESGKFALDSIVEDAELNLRINAKYSTWKAIFDDQLFCFQFYPQDFRTLYLQQMRWNKANIEYTVKGVTKVKGMGFRQKFLYISSFLNVIFFPLVLVISLGMILVQFFAMFFESDVSFVYGGPTFFFLLSIVSFFISFVTMFIFTYPKYRKNPQVKIARKTIIIGIFLIMYIVGFVFGVVSINSLKEAFRRKKKPDVFVKVDKSEFIVPELAK